MFFSVSVSSVFLSLDRVFFNLSNIDEIELGAVLDLGGIELGI